MRFQTSSITVSFGSIEDACDTTIVGVAPKDDIVVEDESARAAAGENMVDNMTAIAASAVAVRCRMELKAISLPFSCANLSTNGRFLVHSSLLSIDFSRNSRNCRCCRLENG